MIQGDFRRLGMGITLEALYESGVIQPLRRLDAFHEQPSTLVD
jgi:hypothetical protein